jgi:molecular chaperone GrpE (heat shock protein)
MKENENLENSEAKQTSNRNQQHKETGKEKNEGFARMEKYLQRILNSGLVVSNAVKDIKEENNHVLSKVEGFVVNVLQAAERRESRVESTLQGFRKAFTEEIGMLRQELLSTLREKAFLETIDDWLSVLDDVDQVSAASLEMESDEAVNYSNSVRVLSDKIMKILTKFGFIEQKVTAGETEFDPEQHCAVPPANEQDVKEGALIKPGFVVRVHRRGFLYKGNLFRPAEVVVAPAHDKTAESQKEPKNK